MSGSNCCGGGACHGSSRSSEEISLAGVPVTVNGEPDVPNADDEAVEAQIEDSEATASVPSEDFEPTHEEWVEGAAPAK